MAWYDYTPPGAMYNLAKKGYGKLKEADDKSRYKPDAKRFDVPDYQRREADIDKSKGRAIVTGSQFKGLGQDIQGQTGGLAQQLGGYQDPRLDQDPYSYWKAKMRGEDSLAQKQLGEATDRARKFALAQSATGRGNPALAARLASQQASQQEMGLAGQAAMAGIQERASAGQMVGQMAGQNLQAALQAQGLRQQGMLGATGMGIQGALGAGQLQLGAGQQALGAQELGLKQALGQQQGQISMEQFRMLAAQNPQLWEKLLQMGSQAGAAIAGAG